MEILKNIAYAGVGLATVTSEKVKETINDLVEKGMISDTEGKKIVEDFFNSTDKKREEFESKFKIASDKITEKFDFFNKDKEIQALNNKIDKLEIELKKAKKQRVKKTTNTTK
jgi:polyhydroxyalkanoate synthesis regulator phasin